MVIKTPSQNFYDLRLGRRSSRYHCLYTHIHCVKKVHIRSFSGSYFPAFGLNRERYSVSFQIQSEYGKIRTRKTSNSDTFHAVIATW